MSKDIKGPLYGVRVIEFAGLAPTPFAGLILADYGADVIRVDIPSSSPKPKPTADILTRKKRSIAIDAKNPEGRSLLLGLIEKADVLLDPFRPGTLEKLGLGPEVFLGTNIDKYEMQMKVRNEKLVFARVAGFAEGPYRNMAGHDINYIALSGILSMFPGAGKPSFPLNILSDFAGGGLICAMGIVLALLARGTSGKGQIVDVDMVSGARYVSMFPLLHYAVQGSSAFGRAEEDGGDGRSTGLLDGGAPFYDVYNCKGGNWISVGCLEPQFFKAFILRFVEALPETFIQDFGWVPDESTQSKQKEWPRLRSFMEKGFLTKARDEWTAVFAGSDACTVPVLTPTEAGRLSATHIPLPHPRLHGTQDVPVQSPTPLIPGQHTEEILREAGFSSEETAALWGSGALGKARSKL